MPIEFPCTTCGKLLRTADETAGQSAKCPACGALTRVPERTESASPSGTPGAMDASPFSGAEARPEVPYDAANPYRAPVDTGRSAMPDGVPFVGASAAINRVQGPGIGLIVMGSLALAQAVMVTALYGFFLVSALSGQPMPDGFDGPEEEMILGAGVWTVAGVIGMILSVVTIVGGVKMKNLRSYGLALTGAIICTIPICGLCCILGVPFGVWALVVLCNTEVRMAFR